MHVFLTDIEASIRLPIKKPHGKINLHTLSLWPAWTFPKFTTLFSYERGGEKIVVPVVMGKTYTFRDLELLVNKHLNSDDQVALLYHNNGRVTWRVVPPKTPSNPKISTGMVNFLRPSNIELSTGLKELLNLNLTQEYNGILTGQPIDKSSINFTFSDATMVFLTCDQIDDTYVNDLSSKTIAVIPLDTGALTLTLTAPTPIVFKENYAERKLNFKLRDKDDNELPVKQMLAHLTIND